MRINQLIGGKEIMPNSMEFYHILLKGEKLRLQEIIQKSIENGESAQSILKERLEPAMEKIGIKFKNDEIYIPEVLVAAQTMHKGLELLRPILSETKESRGIRFVLGTVKTDVHDIGKNLVGMMLEGAGFDVIDIGTNAPPEKFIEAAKKENVKIIGMSSLLTTTMPYLKTTIDSIKEAGLGNKVKTMIGGAPVSEKYAQEIGADGYAPEAGSAVLKAKELLKLS